jgi:hypothetical protein
MSRWVGQLVGRWVAQSVGWSVGGLLNWLVSEFIFAGLSRLPILSWLHFLK